MILSAIYVAATLVIDVPGVVHKEIPMDIERRACGQMYHGAVTDAGGQKRRATAGVLCGAR